MMLRQTSHLGHAPHRAAGIQRPRRASLVMRWALATVAPWALSTGLLVSFTASAGQPRDNAETLVLRVAPDASSDIAIGPSFLSASSAFNLPALFLNETLAPGNADQARYETARYSYEEPQRLVPMNEYKPRSELKSSIGSYPELDRTKKTDPLVGLRPTLTRAPAKMSGDDLDKLMFDTSHGELTAQFAPDDGDIQSEPQGFMPFVYSSTPRDDYQLDDSSPVTSSALTPPTLHSLRSAERRLESIDGSTPSTSRALVLSSSTPVSEDMQPIEIAAAPVSPRETPVAAVQPSRSFESKASAKAEAATRSVIQMPSSKTTLDSAFATASNRINGRNVPGVTIARKTSTTPSSERPDYVALIGSDKMEREQKCLAEAVYYEARSEPEDGQAAVAQVVLNRVKSGLYPDSVCGVVYQNRHRYLACQFTFACEGRALRINEPESWANAVRVAKQVTEGHTYLADVGNSTHYHADYVRPWWARRLTKMDVIGRHVFYKLKPGQT